MITKPANPRIHHWAGAPVFWAAMDGPRRTYASDTGDVADLCGSAPAGTRAAGVTWAAGPYGPVIDCANAASSSSLASPIDFGTGPITISCHLLVRSLSVDMYPTIQLNSAGPAALGIEVDHGKVYVYFGNGSTAVFYTTPIAANAWYHVVGVRSGTPGAKSLYFNGSAVPASSVGATNPAVTMNRFVVGGSTFNGQVADLRIWPRALAADEVAREYADPWWRLRPPSRVATFFLPRNYPAALLMGA